jgi:hypothetical protein
LHYTHNNQHAKETPHQTTANTKRKTQECKYNHKLLKAQISERSFQIIIAQLGTAEIQET